ncbi:MAG: T9SS type A sorting domain-containing protein [Calditrichaceae bacterium]|nr:T9SS type A sorting domain-containing protein [Calditrichaceae bacterium]
MDVRLAIYNVNGQLIRNIYHGSLKKDEYNFKWDGTDNTGRVIQSGIYFLYMQSGFNVQTKKIIMIK